jgi:hypothetical protein
MIQFRVSPSLLLLLGIVFTNEIFGQKTSKKANTPNVSCAGKVYLIDSEYLFCPELIVKSSRDSIKIPQRLYYEVVNPCEEVKGTTLTLQKLVSKTYTYLLTDAFRLPIVDLDFHKWRTYSSESRLTDTINLKLEFPLEVGNYRLSLGIAYYYQGKKYVVTSDWVYFDVIYPPKNPLF